MKGIVRSIDELGRIVLPIEIRRQLDFVDRQGVSLCIINKTIRLEKGKGRKLDELGRYTLPIEIRRGLNLKYKSPIDIWVEGEMIYIKKLSKKECAICEETDEGQLMDIDDVLICRGCGLKVVDKFMEE